MRKSIKKIILMCTIVISMFANNVYAASTDSTSNSMKNQFLDSGFRQFQINKMPSKSLYISFFPSNFLKKFVVYVVY